MIFKIYLAGKMSGLTFHEMNSWRKELKQKLIESVKNYNIKLIVINPCDYYNFEEIMHQNEEEVEDFDLRHATSSDLVIVNLQGLNTSDGSKIEIHDCKYHNGIPVIGLGNKLQYDSLHPWIKRDITRVEESIDDVVLYVKEFYFSY